MCDDECVGFRGMNTGRELVDMSVSDILQREKLAVPCALCRMFLTEQSHETSVVARAYVLVRVGGGCFLRCGVWFVISRMSCRFVE